MASKSADEGKGEVCVLMLSCTVHIAFELMNTEH